MYTSVKDSETSENFSYREQLIKKEDKSKFVCLSGFTVHQHSVGHRTSEVQWKV